MVRNGRVVREWVNEEGAWKRGVEGGKGVLDSTGWEKENVWIEEGKVTLIYTRLIGTRAGPAPEMHSTELQHRRVYMCVWKRRMLCISVCLLKSEVRGVSPKSKRSASMVSLLSSVSQRSERVENRSVVTVAQATQRQTTLVFTHTHAYKVSPISSENLECTVTIMI